jgi:hypothetical protein
MNMGATALDCKMWNHLIRERMFMKQDVEGWCVCWKLLTETLKVPETMSSHRCFQENETSDHKSYTGTKTIRKRDSDLVFVKCSLGGLAILSTTVSAFCKTETEWNHNHGLGRNDTYGRSNKLANCGRRHRGNNLMLVSAFLLPLIEYTVFIVKEIITYCFIDLLFQILSLPRNSSKIDCGLPAKGNTIVEIRNQDRLLAIRDC